MAHFAHLDSGNKVISVVVIANEEVPDEATGIAFCKSLFGSETTWLQTSYNNNIRKRYAGIGMSYDQDKDAFISQQPFASWTLNEDLVWAAPVAKPQDALSYKWDEATLQWIERPQLPPKT